MKKAILLGIIGFLIFIVNNISAQSSTKEYARNKMKEIIFKQTRNEGNFNFVLVPQPLEFFIAFAYPQWEEKRYTYKKMILEAKELEKEFEKERKIFATLFISFVKD